MLIKWKANEVFEEVCEYLENAWDKEVIVVISNKITKEIKSRYQECFYYWMFWEIEKQTPYSADTIKHYLLWRVFWKKEIFWEIVNIKTKTSDFSRKEAIEFIESIIMFIEENTLTCKYTSRELESLYNSYN
jgi:hypothetical protein